MGEAAAGRVLFIFVDGVGLGAADAAVNPLVGARLPVLRGLLGGRAPVAEIAPVHAAASLVALDALLGVPGLPQSGTGQAALLTGENAPRLFGRHYGPWTPTRLRPLVAERSVLARAVAAGRRVAFANAYPEEVVATRAARSRAARARDPLRAAPPLAARAAGLLTRHTAALGRGDAVASEITNEGWREHLGRLSLPATSPRRAGHNLARIAAAHDLTLFAHYATDTAGHRRDLATAAAALERVDAFLGGVLEALPPDVLVVVASDHGNIEDVRVGHTMNPALALVAGPDHAAFAAGLDDLTDVAPAILARLGIDARDAA
ncbi:MAG TPA: alkaline phosphatase family protein [Longimicrobiales bacterium]